MAKKQEYGNESITSLKGADRVRKRPAVIFGSDGVEGCAHSIFEIVSNSIDEARDGHGDTINVTRCKDGSVLYDDAAVLAAGHVDGIAVAVTGFVDGVGHDLKDRVGTALHTV